MADFKTGLDFRKGRLNKRYPYQDPTYLSFVLLFDRSNPAKSPLFSGAAEAWMQENLIDGNNVNATKWEEKLEALQNFKKALFEINSELPWTFQTLTGLDRLAKYNKMNAYWGGDDAAISIACLESLNLPVAGLMHLYKKAVWDDEKWTYVLPANLRKFSVGIYVTEIRQIKNQSKPTIGGLPKANRESLREFPSNFKPTLGIENSNSGISGSKGRPFFYFQLGYCEWLLDSGSTPFADLSKNPEGAAVNTLDFTYEQLHKVDARVLNGMIVDSRNDEREAPSYDPEDLEHGSLKDYLLSKGEEKLKDLEERAVGDLERMGQQKVQELNQQASDIVRRNTPNFENIYQDFVQGVDSATDLPSQQREVSQQIFDNVFADSVPPGTNIGDALNNAARESLGNIHDGDG